jgi:site-specific DNA recombinase
MTTPRAALYARVSTDDQVQKYGLASQLRELRAIAARRVYTIPPGAEYVDDGYSGATLERPALARLRETARAGAIDVVLIHDPDRLSRSLGHQLLLLEEFERARIRVEFATITTQATPEGNLLLHVKGAIGEYERLKIRERTMRGRREKARRGFAVNPQAYGYGPDPAAPGRVGIRPAEADIVRLIYGWLIDEQMSVRRIVEALRRQALPARRARRWAPTSVRRILTNEIYTGRAYYNREEVGVDAAGRRRRTLRPVSEWIPIAVPALITPERFAAAQTQLARNRAFLTGRPARTAVYLLRGLLRCGACGRRYTSCPSHGRRYYRCSQHDRLAAQPCRAGWLSARVAEGDVWQAVTELLRDPAALQRAVEGHAARLGVREVELRSEADHVGLRLAQLERQEQRLLDLYLDESLRTEALRGRLEDLGRRRTELRARQARLEAAATAQRAREGSHDAIARWCTQARRGLERLDAAGRQRFLGAIVREIVVRGHDLEIHGMLPAPADLELRRPASQSGQYAGAGYLLVISAEGRR